MEPEPLSFFAPENVYVDRAGFESLLVTMRRTLADAEYTGGRGSSLILAQWGETAAGFPRWMINRDDLGPSGRGATDRYQQVSMSNEVYGYIKDANVVISRIDEIEWQSMDARNQILAEALWHRAYWYNRLVHSYGDVPFVGEEITSARIDFQTHSRWTILDKLEEDLEYAVQHLPESAVPGAVTRGAGYHLLSKVYLANLNFEQARDAASTVINGPYALMTERFGQDLDQTDKTVIWDLHRWYNKNDPANTETILAIVDRFEAPEGARDGNGLRTMRTYHNDWWHSRHRDSQGGAGMIDAGTKYDSLGRGNPDVALTEFYQYHVWEDHLGNTWEDTPDMRRGSDPNWYDVDEHRYNNPESVDYGEPWDPANTSGDIRRLWTSMYALPIYKTMVFESDPAARPMGGNGDWYLFRLAETYLIRAEANYWLNNLAAAADDINAVRERAGAVPITAGDVTIDYIMDERVRELFAEGMQQNELARVSMTMAEVGGYGYDPETLHESNYWHDRLIRLNNFFPDHPESGVSISHGLPYPVGDFGVGPIPNINPHNYLWPISDDLIEANVLGRVNQNLGYPGAGNNEPPLTTIE